MIVRPNAKINIGLNIISKEADGYHNIETVMVPFDLTDSLKLSENKKLDAKKFELVIDGLPVDGSLDSNLVSRAYYLINADYTLPPVKATLSKKIPMGAGLGGGSADCAFMIKALNEMFQLNITIQQMQRYAAMLGSDCAFFIENKPIFSYGRGDKFAPINLDLSGYTIVIVKPTIHVNTKEAYQMTTPQPPQYQLLDLIKMQPTEWKNTITNDFEKPIFAKYPQLQQIKDSLYSIGATYSAMSGSGSAIFGLFDSQPDISKITFDNCFVWSGKL